MHPIETRYPKIKICGIFRPEDVGVLNETLPDYVGFVFAEKSHRYVTAAQAKALRNNIDPRITTVGVFVDADPGFITELVREGTIGAVQLHGHEEAAYGRALREQLPPGIPIIRAVTVKSAAEVSAGTEDLVLFDHGDGGTGRAFDHEVIREAAARGTLTKLPFFIAGGLNAENVSAVLSLPLFGVDVSGGVETDGVKDPEKIRRFVDAVRRAGNEPT
jgi:phosphoribosylanthranilate isomerase